MIKSFDTMIERATDLTIDHGGGGGQAADESDDGEDIGAALQRQRQHEHVAVHAARRKGQQAGERNRNHEQIYQHKIEQEYSQTARLISFSLLFSTTAT